MLRLIETDFSRNGHNRIREEISLRIENGERVFLIVPEQHTVTVEREMTELLPPFAPITFEVTNFTRLSNTVFREIGGISGEYSTPAKESLIMWRTLTELAPYLESVRDKGDISHGTVNRAMEAISEMRSIGITSDDLDSVSSDTAIASLGQLKSKLTDLSMIMTVYKRLLGEKYLDVGDDIEALTERLSEKRDYLSGISIYIEDFTSFTEPQINLICALLLGCDVTVLLTRPRDASSFFEFAEVNRTRDRLLSAADKASVSKRIEKLYGDDEERSLAISTAQKLLWRSTGTIDPEIDIGDSIRIFEASDVYEECDFVAADIKRRVMDGCSYSDFAVVARSIDQYVGLIDDSLAKAGIPAFISKRRSALSLEGIKMIFAAFQVINEGYERSALLSYMKCGLTGVSRDLCDEFEIYVQKWQIDRRRFTDGIAFGMSPGGYSRSELTENDVKALGRINETRNKIIEQLTSFESDLEGAKTVKDHAEALVKFLISVDMENGLKRRAEELRTLGEDESAEITDRLWKLIIDMLDETVDAVGDLEVNSSAFENQLKTVFATVDVGRIPSFCDVVTVGSADMLRVSGKKHVYLIGVNQGEFPSAVHDGSYFSERDRSILTAAGLKLENTKETGLARELFVFRRAFCSANESVTLLYANRSSALVAVLPADIIKRIVTLTEKRVIPVPIRELSAKDRIYFPEAAMEELGKTDENTDAFTEALRMSGRAEDLKASLGRVKNTSLKLSPEAANALYPGSIRLTQSRIDSYVGCPLSHYLRYDLKLDENKEAKFDRSNIGSFVHAVLEYFFMEVIDTGISISDLRGEKKEEMIDRSARKYLASMNIDADRTKRGEHFLKGLKRSSSVIVDGLIDELEGSKFLPRFFELEIPKFDTDGLPSPARYTANDGRTISVYGKIDRVDTYRDGDKTYVRIIDYKTGSKTFSPSDIDKGKNLQMFLYLKSIEESGNKKFLSRIDAEDGNIIPAGVIYIKTDMSDVRIPRYDGELAVSEVKKKQERKGMLLDDPESISAMNPDYIPIRFSKGGIDSRSAANLYTMDGWHQINEKIEGKLREVTDGMISGDISSAKSKKDSPCDFCPFKPVCRAPKV